MLVLIYTVHLTQVQQISGFQLFVVSAIFSGFGNQYVVYGVNQFFSGIIRRREQRVVPVFYKTVIAVH